MRMLVLTTSNDPYVCLYIHIDRPSISHPSPSCLCTETFRIQRLLLLRKKEGKDGPTWFRIFILKSSHRNYHHHHPQMSHKTMTTNTTQPSNKPKQPFYKTPKTLKVNVTLGGTLWWMSFLTIHRGVQEGLSWWTSCLSWMLIELETMSSGEALRRKPELPEAVSDSSNARQSVSYWWRGRGIVTSGEVTKKIGGKSRHCLRFEDNFGLPTFWGVQWDSGGFRMKKRRFIWRCERDNE